MVVLKGEGTLDQSDLPDRLRGPTEASLPSAALELPAEGLDFRDAVDDFERRMIREALSRAQGNKSRAARLLNMRRTTFIEKLKRLSPADEGGDPLPDEQA